MRAYEFSSDMQRTVYVHARTRTIVLDRNRKGRERERESEPVLGTHHSFDVNALRFDERTIRDR